MEDRELDDYLRGTSRLSAAYREARGEEPSADIDEVLLERSRRELRLGPKVAWSPFTRSWSLPLALAAMLVVSVSVTLLMYEETGEPLPVPARPPAERLAAPKAPAREETPPAPAAKPAAPASAQPPAPQTPLSIEKRISLEHQQEPAAGAAREAAPAGSREASPLAPAMQAVPVVPRAEEKAAPSLRANQEAARDADLGADPEAWVRRIETLRREGRHAEADALLAEFRKRFPDYPADKLPK